MEALRQTPSPSASRTLDLTYGDDGMCIAGLGTLAGWGVVARGDGARLGSLSFGSASAHRRSRNGEHDDHSSTSLVPSGRLTKYARPGTQRVRDFGACTLASALVVEATGMRANFFRSVVTGMYLNARTQTQYKVLGSISEATQWVVGDSRDRAASARRGRCTAFGRPAARRPQQLKLGGVSAAAGVYNLDDVIIFGTRGVTYSADSGTFHCPQCAGQSGYRQRRVRRFFTLYFIPVIPLDKLGEYIECDNCAGTFTEGVLNYDPSAEDRMIEAAYHSACKRVMVLMMLADGIIDDDEIEAIQGIYQAIVGRPVSQGEVREEIRQAQSDGAQRR